MTTDEVLGLLRERGLQVVQTDEGLVLRGPASEKTPKLLRVLAIHRDEIKKRLGGALPEPAGKEEKRLGGAPEDVGDATAGAEEIGSFEPPFWIEYLFCSGHRRTYRVGRLVPQTAWWWRMAGPGMPLRWERTIYCPVHVESPADVGIPEKGVDG